MHLLIGAKSKENNLVGAMNLTSYHTLSELSLQECMIIGKDSSSFELDAEKVKKQNSSPGMLGLIMPATSELPIGLGSHNLSCAF